MLGPVGTHGSLAGTRDPSLCRGTRDPGPDRDRDRLLAIVDVGCGGSASFDTKVRQMLISAILAKKQKSFGKTLRNATLLAGVRHGFGKTLRNASS